ncbi:hypothetical protein QMY06_07615 [Pediococcus acidilactici]|uniref:hypothetical protein n=1 Tax=Pediococcus acidilactici TaxID=1254 RepID=UPI002549CC79|nr:hypothetical protein [Pediococcus acidilactici]WIL71475.1 hypothetical protein QMY06_07615 [Pediococcus acidilactici]
MTTNPDMKALVRKVNKHDRMLAHHIGSGGDVEDGLLPHKIANTNSAGFMNPTMFRQLRSANGQYTWKENGTDVLTLPEGRYRIVGSPNRPTDNSVTEANLIMYDVYIKDNFKKITATIAYDGERYMYVEYDGKVVVNWAYLPAYTLLFAGYQSSGKITIPADINSFRGIKIDYSLVNIRRSVEYEASKEAREYELVVPGHTHENDTWMSSNQMILHFSDSKTIVIDSNKRINYDGTGAVNTQAGAITIERIYGIV